MKQRKQVTHVINQTEIPALQPGHNLNGEDNVGVMMSAVKKFSSASSDNTQPNLSGTVLSTFVSN